MRMSALLGLACSLASGQLLAAACDVVTRSSSEAIAPVERHTCYSFTHMPAEAIAWSCSNESKEMLNSQKKQVGECAQGSVGRCSVALTQEALANPNAGGSDQPSTRPSIPEQARVVTQYYSAADLAQARSDCERNDGIWHTQ